MTPYKCSILRKYIRVLFSTLLFFTFQAFADPVITTESGQTIIDEGVAQNSIIRQIGGHKIEIEIGDSFIDTVKIDNNVVFGKSTDEFPALGISAFSCEFYFVPIGAIPTNIKLVIGLCHNNHVWYLQYAFIEKHDEGAMDIHVFLIPERNDDWNIVSDRRKIYYFLEHWEK